MHQREMAMRDADEIKKFLEEKAASYEFEYFGTVSKDDEGIHIIVRAQGKQEDGIKKFIDETFETITKNELILIRILPTYESVKNTALKEVKHCGYYRFSIKL